MPALVNGGGTFHSATGGTFQSDTDGTFHSDMPGTFESDMDGTFKVMQSNCLFRKIFVALKKIIFTYLNQMKNAYGIKQ